MDWYCPLNRRYGSFVLLVLFYVVCCIAAGKAVGLGDLKGQSSSLGRFRKYTRMCCIVLYNCFMEKAYNLSTKLCGLLHELLRVQRKEESEKIGVVKWEFKERVIVKGAMGLVYYREPVKLVEIARMWWNRNLKGNCAMSPARTEQLSSLFSCLSSIFVAL